MHRSIAAMLLTLLSALTAAQAAEPSIQWDSKDVVESRMTRYKYNTIGPAYPKAEKGQPDPGTNFMIELTVSDEPPALMDRLLKRDAKLSGKIAAAPAAAQAGRVWIEDNYGRVIDQADVKAPDFAFSLDAARALKLGVSLKAELKTGDQPAWSGKTDIRLIPWPQDDGWGDFVLGAYNTGEKPGHGELYRQIGLSHKAVQTTNSPVYDAQQDLRFHASNILYSLLGFYHRDYTRWRAIQAAERKEQGAVKLERHRCLSNPKEEKFATDILTAAALRFAPYRPLHYSIGDEIGIGDMASPHDLCASQWCLPRYRAWLKERYGAIDKLNAQWAAAYKGFDEAEMMSNWQALERAGTGNFSPWADRLEFMDTVLYGAVAKGVSAVRKVDPKATCNLSGVQQPAAWCFDHYLLSKTVNCATPYEIGEGPDVLMSFWNDGRDGKLVAPGFGKDMDGLWRSFNRGYSMCQQWDVNGVYSHLIDIDKQQPTDLGLKVKSFADWAHAGPGRLRNVAQRQRDPVAILYSQPSLRGNWMLEMTARPELPETGKGWIGRGSWSVRKREMYFRVRTGWVQWLHDIGIWPRWVDSRQVDEDFLTKNGYKVLVLPRAVAISDQTAAKIRQFAEQGGTVIADTWCGIMDEHCRIRLGTTGVSPVSVAGVLDDLFGVTRGDYRQIDITRFEKGKGIKLGDQELPFVAFEKTLKSASQRQSDGSPANRIVNTVGKGRAVYLNFDMESYFLHRLNAEMVLPARQFLQAQLQEAGVKPPFWVGLTDGGANAHPAGHDVCVYRNGRGWLVGVMQNPTVMHSEVGGIETRYTEVKDNVFSKEHAARLNVPAGLHAYDLTDAKPVAEGKPIDFASKPGQGRFYAFWPFKIEGLEAKAEVKDGRVKLTGKVKTSGEVKDETLVVHVRALRPDGSEQAAYRRTIDCAGGAFAVEWPMGLNEHGDWTLQLREPCTGQVQGVKVNVP